MNAAIALGKILTSTKFELDLHQTLPQLEEFLEDHGIYIDAHEVFIDEVLKKPHDELQTYTAQMSYGDQEVIIGMNEYPDEKALNRFCANMNKATFNAIQKYIKAEYDEVIEESEFFFAVEKLSTCFICNISHGQ